MPVELSDDLYHMRTVYKQGDKEVAVTVLQTNGHTSYMDENIGFEQQKMTVKGTEILYTEYEGGRKTITWIKSASDTEYMYQIDAPGELSKEDLVKIAEAYLK